MFGVLGGAGGGPTCTPTRWRKLEAPVAEGVFYSDHAISFEGTASDAEDAAALLL